MNTPDQDQPTSDDVFATAFGEATGEQTTAPEAAAPAAPAAEEPAAPATEEPAAPAAAATTEEPAAPATEEPAAPTAEQPAAAATTEQPPIDPKYIAQAVLEAQAAQQQQAQQRQQEEQQRQQATKVWTADELLSDEDKAAVAKFKEEWPTEHAAIQRMYQAELRAHVANEQNKLIVQLQHVLAPLFEKVGQVEVNGRIGGIRSAHADYDQILPEVKQWIGQQPTFLQSGYLAALENGSVQDASAVLAAYKQAKAPSGAAPATPASTATQASTPAPKPAVPAAAVAATAAVPASQRTQQSKANDPLNFEAAFAEASALLTS